MHDVLRDNELKQPCRYVLLVLCTLVLAATSPAFESSINGFVKTILDKVLTTIGSFTTWRTLTSVASFVNLRIMIIKVHLQR